MQIKSVNPALRPVDTEECILDVVDTVQAQSTQKNITIRTDIQATQILGDKTILDIALRNILTNAIKFSHPGTNVFITTKKGAGEISISIRDEGLGINKEQLRQLQLNQTESRPGTAGESGSGLGIFLAKELLQKVNARLIIESEVGKGSCFTIAAPALA
jgi:signal transduction histidine kinase